MAKRSKPAPRRRGPEHRINQFIRAQEVRLVADDIEPGVYTLEQALALAQEKELDLVEISASATPPVCKIVDYGKFLYDQKKKQKELKAKQVKVVVKEIRFGPNTDQHDFDFKLKHARKFLEEGSKIKAYVFFKGRTIIYKEKGRELLHNFITQLNDVGTQEGPIKMEGKKMNLFIAPLKKK